jgi:hypothetical protein
MLPAIETMMVSCMNLVVTLVGFKPAWGKNSCRMLFLVGYAYLLCNQQLRHPWTGGDSGWMSTLLACLARLEEELVAHGLSYRWASLAF